MWNYRDPAGAGGGFLIFLFLKETMRRHSPSMTFLSEKTNNRKTTIKRVQRQLNMVHGVTMEPMRLSRGLAIFWSNNI